MFSKTCKYAIRAMIFVAQNSKQGRKVGIKEISNGINSPEAFIAKILQELSRREIVQSVKGPNGGFYLDKNSMKLTLADIVQAIDGDKLFSSCGLGLEQCSELQPCPLHNQFKHIRKEIYSVLKRAKLIELTEDLEKSMTFLKN